MRRLRRSKKRHEAAKFINRHYRIFEKYAAIISKMEIFTTNVRDDGLGVFLVPAGAKFERITPTSEPTGITFNDGSFLAIKELFTYDYQNDEATEPQIGFTSFPRKESLRF